MKHSVTGATARPGHHPDFESVARRFAAAGPLKALNLDPQLSISAQDSSRHLHDQQPRQWGHSRWGHSGSRLPWGSSTSIYEHDRTDTGPIALDQQHWASNTGRDSTQLFSTVAPSSAPSVTVALSDTATDAPSASGPAYASTVQLSAKAYSTHHLVHYKQEGIVLILRKILTELRLMVQFYERKLGQRNFHKLEWNQQQPLGCRSRVHRQIFGA